VDQQVWVNTLLLIIKDNFTTIYWRKYSRDSGNGHLYILKMIDFESLFLSLVSLNNPLIFESNKHPKCTFLLKPTPCRIHFVASVTNNLPSMQTQTVPFKHSSNDWFHIEKFVLPSDLWTIDWTCWNWVAPVVEIDAVLIQPGAWYYVFNLSLYGSNVRFSLIGFKAKNDEWWKFGDNNE